jgi:hypothetical protein
MKHWYKGIKARRGSKIARVAVMRRLATIMWHMLKHHEAYCIGGPPRRKHGAAAGENAGAGTAAAAGSATADFRRDGKGVQGKKEKKRPPARGSRRKPEALLAHP